MYPHFARQRALLWRWGAEEGRGEQKKHIRTALILPSLRHRQLIEDKCIREGRAGRSAGQCLWDGPVVTRLGSVQMTPSNPHEIRAQSYEAHSERRISQTVVGGGQVPVKRQLTVNPRVHVYTLGSDDQG